MVLYILWLVSSLLPMKGKALTMKRFLSFLNFRRSAGKIPLRPNRRSFFLLKKFLFYLPHFAHKWCRMLVARTR